MTKAHLAYYITIYKMITDWLNLPRYVSLYSVPSLYCSSLIWHSRLLPLNFEVQISANHSLFIDSTSIFATFAYRQNVAYSKRWQYNECLLCSILCTCKSYVIINVMAVLDSDATYIVKLWLQQTILVIVVLGSDTVSIIKLWLQQTILVIVVLGSDTICIVTLR